MPLHYAVMNEAPEEVVKALLEAHPEGAKEKGQVRAPLSTLSPCAVEQSSPRYHLHSTHTHIHNKYIYILQCVLGRSSLQGKVNWQLICFMSCHLTWPWNVDTQLRSSLR